MAEPEPEVVARGPVRIVRFLVLPDGSAPARDTLKALMLKKQTKAKAMAVIRTAERLATERLLSRKLYRKFDATFWEVVSTGCRVLTYTHRGELLLVHAFLKNEDQADPTEVAEARRHLKQFLAFQGSR